MPTVFPTNLDSFINPTAADTLNSATVPHADQHANINDAVEALEAKVGVDGSAVPASLDNRVFTLEASSHAALTLGTANGLSLLGQALSLAVATAGNAGALSAADWTTFNSKQSALTFPLSPSLGGTGVDNGANALTVPATGTAALLATQNIFTAPQEITATSTTVNALNSIVSINPTYSAGVTAVSAQLRSLNLNAVLFGSGGGAAGLVGLRFAAASQQTAGVLAYVYGITGTAGNNNAGTITEARGLNGALVVTGSGNITAGRVFTASTPTLISTGVIVTNTGFYVQNQGATGITTANGLYIESQSGAGANYAIFTNLGLNRLGDQLSIVGSVDRNQLIVTGFTTQTLPPAHFIDNTATTNAIRNILQLEARSTGTAAANFGVGLPLYAETATNSTYQQQGLISSYWVDATNATRKATLALSAYDTAERKGIEIRANGTTPDIVLLGDTWWEGEEFGLPYASIWGNEIGWTQATAVQNTWYEIADADMSDGQLNLVTHDGSGKLTIAKAGRYLINYTISAECSLPNKHVQSGISVSGTEQSDGIDHMIPSVANEQFHLASTAILDLTANATIEISIRTTDAGTPDLAVDHLNVSIVHIGGT